MDERQKHIIGYSTQMNRIDRGLSIEELANEAGLDPEVLEAIEAGRYEVTGAIVNQIAEAMDIPNWNLMV